MENLLTLPVLLPLFGAALTLAFDKLPRVQRWVSGAVQVAVVAVAVTLVFLVDSRGTQVLWVGNWPQPLGITLVADHLSALMLLVSTVVTATVFFYSMGQDLDTRQRETPVSVFHPTFLVLSAGVSDAFLAGDLFNLFVGFEILLFASYVLITIGATRDRVRSGTTYVVVGVLSSSLFLTAIAAVYAATGTVNLAQLSVRLSELSPGVSLMLQLLLLTVFAVKAAVFPLSAWLPDSYPTAPAPVTAVFAGLLTKVGVYSIIRTQTLLFPNNPLSALLMWAALLTMVIGILGAVAQSEIKRMLSFTLVSHIGYMIFGVSLGTQAGLAGAIFYTAHHITIQTTLFLVVGLIERRGGTTSLNRLGGLAAVSPLLGILFFIPAMNLAGIPPLSGFIGKIGLFGAGVQVGTPLAWLLVAGSVVTSLLTLYAMAKVWNRAFWRDVPEQLSDQPSGLTVSRRHGARRGTQPTDGRGAAHPEVPAAAEPTPGGTGASPTRPSAATGTRPDPSELWEEANDSADGGVLEPSRVPRPMAATAGVLVVLGIGLTVIAGPLYGYCERAAAELSSPGNYVGAVLGDGALLDGPVGWNGTHGDAGDGAGGADSTDNQGGAG
ncbi:Na+/H+ antiporter subunit D [Nakamurella aerolata]|uniref:Na+/H+ antiporter subunit D n=1 Tax=Nakamurella aerolata TaxID=1656892 RepID=A0A849AAI1_9ACTN|nr:Na+/H+ antiporter subunit D [Nakamurella aerolata]NNG36967.1 Na+/H+ antiporter subunit D [Nakamurella aerolata]